MIKFAGLWFLTGFLAVEIRTDFLLLSLWLIMNYDGQQYGQYYLLMTNPNPKGQLKQIQGMGKHTTIVLDRIRFVPMLWM